MPPLFSARLPASSPKEAAALAQTGKLEPPFVPAVADRDPANSLTAVLAITKALTVIESGDAAEVLAYDGCCAPPVMLSEPVVGAESREARAGPYRPTSTQGKCVRTTIIDKLTWLNNLT